MAKKRTNLKMVTAERYDSWANAFTGVNIKNRDKRTKMEAVSNILTEAEIEQIYAADSIAAKIVDTMPEDMVREGFKLTIEDFKEEDIRRINEYLEANLHWKGHFQQGLSWARMYGGSALLLGVDDGEKDLSTPLNWSNIKRFDFMTLFHRFELMQQGIQNDPSKPGYGLPALYALQPRTGEIARTKSKVVSMTGARIHASRLIRFDGNKLPRKAFVTNGYWHDSVLSRMKMPLADYGHSFDATAALMGDVAQAIFKVKNLHEILASKDGEALLQKRLDLLDMSRSVVNALMIADEEEFERKTTSLTGISEILTKMENRLVATSEYPHTILLGEAPGSGLGETGKSELRDYYDAIARKQETTLKPLLRIMIKAMFLDKNGPTKGVEPPSWDIEFHPLWQDRLSDTLDQREKQARIDQIYINAGVISNDEVAQSRFGSGQYSHETDLAYERDEGEANQASSDSQSNLDPNEDDDTNNPDAEGGEGTGAIRVDYDSPIKSPSDLRAYDESELAKMSRTILGSHQTESVMRVLEKVATKQLPRDTGIALLMFGYGLSKKEAKDIMGSIGIEFEPEKPQTNPTPVVDDDMRALGGGAIA